MSLFAGNVNKAEERFYEGYVINGGHSFSYFTSQWRLPHFGEGNVTSPISDFEYLRKTLCVHLILGWCEHPPSTFTREFQCQAQNPLTIPIIRLLNNDSVTVFLNFLKMRYRLYFPMQFIF